MDLRVLSAIVCATVGSAHAVPVGADARAEFDRGVGAYTGGDFAVAASALARSYGLEADTETLFAWAQAERKLGHCDKALELYTKLLTMQLGAENKREIGEHIEECKATTTQHPINPPPAVERRAWWKDPVGSVLVAAGLAGGATGTVLLVLSRDASRDRTKATSYADYATLHDRATSRGQLGVIAAGAGGAFLVLGVVWYAVREQPESPMVTAWLDASGGGVAVTGGF